MNAAGDGDGETIDVGKGGGGRRGRAADNNFQDDDSGQSDGTGAFFNVINDDVDIDVHEAGKKLVDERNDDASMSEDAVNNSSNESGDSSQLQDRIMPRRTSLRRKIPYGSDSDMEIQKVVHRVDDTAR